MEVIVGCEMFGESLEQVVEKMEETEGKEIEGCLFQIAVGSLRFVVGSLRVVVEERG